MPTYRKTLAVADILGVPYWRLRDMVRARRINPPARDDSGDYIWSPSDIEAARQVLAARCRPTPAVATAGGPGDAA